MTLEGSSLIFIQSDWNSIINDVGAEAWVSCKYKDSPGIHGKIRTVSNLPSAPSVTISEGFSVENVSTSSITIKHRDSPYTTVFVAPHRTFSSVHKGSVVCLDINDECLAVSFSSKGSQLLVWDTRTEEVKLSLVGHVFGVYRCRFFPSGKVVLSCSSDMTLRIWCARTGQCPVVLKGHTMAVTDIAFISRGRNVLSTSKDGTVKLWHCGDAAFIANIAKVSSSINCCQVTDAPPFIDIGHRQEPDNEKEVETDDKLVIFGCEDGTLECVAIRTRKVIFSFQVESAVNCIALLGADQFVFGCQNGQLFLCNFKNIENRTMCHESNSCILALLPYKDIGFFVSRADGTVIFVPLNECFKRISLTGSNCDPVYDMASDGKYVFTCCRDGAVRLYIVENMLTNFF